jgi:hypothetical protein
VPSCLKCTVNICHNRLDIHSNFNKLISVTTDWISSQSSISQYLSQQTGYPVNLQPANICHNRLDIHWKLQSVNINYNRLDIHSHFNQSISFWTIKYRYKKISDRNWPFSSLETEYPTMQTISSMKCAFMFKVYCQYLSQQTGYPLKL